MISSVQEKIFDVIIVGAGPSGTSCALTLRKAGLKVALIDKAEFPRDKVCGDAIPGRAVKLLAELDPKFLAAFPPHENKKRISSTRFISFSGTEATVEWKLPAYNCVRLSFDSYLLDLVLKESSTFFFSRTRITDVDILDSHVELKTDKGLFKASIVVACDGAQSLLAKKLNKFTLDRTHYAVAVRAYFEGVKGMKAGCNEVFLSKKFIPGYLWVFPVSDTHTNVGFGMLSDTVAKKKIQLQASLLAVIEEFPELKERFSEANMLGKIEGFGLPLGTRHLRISGKRFLLCGDAASLIDPISGDGIGNGMVSGKLAAEHILKHISANQFTATITMEYDKLVYARLGKELKINTLFLRLTNFFHWLPNIGIFLLSKKNPLSFLFKKLL